MKSLVDLNQSNNYISTIRKLLLVSFIELVLLIVLNTSISSFIYAHLFFHFSKIYIIIKSDERLTSPLFFPSLAFVFWLALGNFVNVVQHKYTDASHYYEISILVTISYIFLIYGIYFGSYIKVKKIKRVFPYLLFRHSVFALYVIILISMISAFIYNIPIIKSLISDNYYSKRINLIYGRGYLNAIGSLHVYLLPFLVLLKFHYNKWIRWIDLFLIFISFILILITLHRGPLLTFFLSYLFVFNDFKRALPVRKVFKYGIFAVIIFGIIIPVVRGINRGYVQILANEIGIHTWNLSHYIGMTDKLGFFGLKPILMALSIILPGHQESFEIWVKQISTISVNVGGASMSLIGEAYMEGGYLSVVLNFALLGFLLAVFFKRRKFSIGSYFIYIYFLNRSESIIQFGFSKVLLTTIIVFTVFTAIDNFKPIKEKNE